MRLGRPSLRTPRSSGSNDSRSHPVALVAVALIACGQYIGYYLFFASRDGPLQSGWEHVVSSSLSPCSGNSSTSPPARIPRDEEGDGAGDRYGGSGDYSLFMQSVPAPGGWPPPLDRPLWSTEESTAEDGPVTITTCIPALLRNLHSNLQVVLSSVQNQTSPADEVAIVVSEITTVMQSSRERTQRQIDNEGTAWCRALLEMARAIVPDIPLRVVCIGDRLTAGWARNVLSRLASSEVLSFVDADDEEFAVRNEVVRNVFDCYRGQLSLFTHSFSGRQRVNVHPYELRQEKLGFSGGVAMYGVPPNLRCADEDPYVVTFYGDKMYDKLWETFDRWKLYVSIADGHMVVHRRVFQHVRFISSMKGEDAMFLRDIIMTFGRNKTATMLYDRPLTWYHSRSYSSQDLAEAGRREGHPSS